MMQLIDIVAAGLKDDSGVALDSGTVTVYQAGTTTPVSIYSDYEGLSPLSNPVTLDSVGRKDIWVNERVKLLIKDSGGSTIRTTDDVGVSDAQIASAAGSLGAGAGLSSSGGSLAVNVDDSTIEINGDTLRVKDDGIVTAKIDDLAVTTQKINDGAITQAKRAALGHQISSSSGDVSITATSLTDVTNMSVSITTTGRPVFITLIADGSTSTPASMFGADPGSSTTATALFAFVRGSTQLTAIGVIGDSVNSTRIPPGALSHVDVPSAGTYTYKLQCRRGGVSGADTTTTARVVNCKLFAYEL